MTRRTLTIVALTGLLAGSALGDWTESDGHKMHWPQLPDPNGWDIAFQSQFTQLPITLADDFLCTASGPITDVHFWISFRGLTAELPPGLIQQSIVSLKLSIHEDIAVEQSELGYSIPGQQLWSYTFLQGDPSVQVAGPWQGLQGWYDPLSQIVQPNDHLWYYQVNVTGIPEPFVQNAGEIYWLDLQLGLVGPDGVDLPPVGWKTSGSDHFNDDAVVFDPALGLWRELRDPIAGTTGPSLDLAFVITPEPATVTLLVLGGWAVMRRRHD